MTYHLSDIPKGVIGESSKIMEEVRELIDSEKQNCSIMTLVELSDIYGSVQLYLENKYPQFTMDDLQSMSDITMRVFRSGARK